MIKKKETALRRLRTSSCKWDDYKNYSPELQRDPDVCLAAVMNAGMALMFIPEECRTREVCLVAVAGDESASFYVPEKYKNDGAFWCDAVKRNGALISRVPYASRTEEMCVDAVRRDARNLYWVSAEMQTPKVCLAAMDNDIRVAAYNIKASVLRAAFEAYSSAVQNACTENRDNEKAEEKE